MLAGFVEAGESLEQAIHREIGEEVDISLSDLHYFGSQPWPFPRSLMVGFFARATSTDICVDADEIAYADWYTRDELTAEAGLRRARAAGQELDRLPADRGLAGRFSAALIPLTRRADLAEVAYGFDQATRSRWREAVAQSAGPVRRAQDRSADRLLGPDHLHLVGGPGDRGVEQLAGQQRRLRRRHHEGDRLELAALGPVHRHRVHGLDRVQPDRGEERRRRPRGRRRPAPRAGVSTITPVSPL